jgi:hypothetical protein
VWRWRPAFQREFQARMDWCVRGVDEANHKPVAVVNGDATRQAIKIAAQPGEVIDIDAGGSSDPDGDALAYRWWVYREAGTYVGDVRIENSDAPQATLNVPDDASGATIHVLLEVTDEGSPPMTAYRRVIISVE